MILFSIPENKIENKMNPEQLYFEDSIHDYQEKFIEEGLKTQPIIVQNKQGYGWWWVGTFIMWLIVLIVIFWIIYFSLKPGFVMNSGTNEVNLSKVLLAAVITSLVIIIIFALLKLTLRSWEGNRK